MAFDRTTRAVDGAAASCGPSRLRDGDSAYAPRSVSGTPSCRGCNDPTCGYCDEIVAKTREERVEAEQEGILGNDRDLLDCLDDVFVADQHHVIAEAIRLALEYDDLAACDRLRDVIRPRVCGMAERRVA